MKANPNNQVGRSASSVGALEHAPPDDIVILVDDDIDIDRSIHDGRHRRSARSRRAIVDAFLSLLQEGVEQPSSTQIAERAGVTQRTLFNQFGDMGALLAALWERQAPMVRDRWPDVGDGDRAERCDALARSLATILEEVGPVRWALLTNPMPSELLQAVIDSFSEHLRTLLSTTFADELDRLDDDERSLRLDALVVACDPTTWRLRRVVHDQPFDVAGAALRCEIEALTAA